MERRQFNTRRREFDTRRYQGTHAPQPVPVPASSAKFPAAYNVNIRHSKP
jgi:hypothetical protein